MNIVINGNPYSANEDMTILEAAKEHGIAIPTLCYLEKINEISACRICVVDVKGKLVPACVTKVQEGMEITTDNDAVRTARRINLELICADHHMDCTDCPRGADCELRELCKEYEVDDHAFGIGNRQMIVDNSMPHLVRDNSKCILCRRCEATCRVVQGIGAIGVNNKGGETNVGFGLPLSETDCVRCGQCISACPTGALSIKDDTKAVWKAILSTEKQKTVAFISPIVCKQVGTLLGAPSGSDCTGKVATMLRRIGFHRICLTGISVTVCPAWRSYLEKRHPALTEKLSSCGTPWERAAAECRSACAEEPVYITVFTPCTAAKATTDAADAVLTARELATMWKRACVSSFTAMEEWQRLPEETFDASLVDAPEAEVAAYGLAEAEHLLAIGKLRNLNVLACPGGCGAK